MSKIEQLREKISTITEIYIGIKENFRFCYHLHQSDSEEERKYLKVDRHLQFIRHSLWRLTVVELCKIFSTRDTDKYDIQRLIKNLKPGGHFDKLGFELQTVLKWESITTNKKEIIDNLNKLRDKIYAHTDPKREIYKGIEVYFQDVSELLEFANRIIQEISITINEPLLLFDSPYFESQEFDLVKILAQHHSLEVEKIRGLINK